METGTWIVLGVLAVVCVIAVVSFVKRMKSGCCGAGGDGVKRVRRPDANPAHYPYVRTVRVEGMHCKSCATRVENAFHEREGFYAKANLSKGCVVVFMKKPVPDVELSRIVSSAGYQPAGVQEGAPD